MKPEIGICVSDELESPRMVSVIFDACRAGLMHRTMLSAESSVKDFSLGSNILSFIYFLQFPF